MTEQLFYGDKMYRNSNGGFNAPQNVSAKLNMPTMSELGGRNQTPWVRFPFFPTAPFMSTNPNVGTQVRYYGATVTSADADMTLKQETIRTVQFDIPVRLIGINGGAVVTDRTGDPTGNSLNGFLFRVEYTTGDKLMTAPRLASTVIGTAENVGEIGSTGYTIDQGASLVLGITPLDCLGLDSGGNPQEFRIDITLVCLEIRGQRNFG